MYDIAGCRVIVKNIDQLECVCNRMLAFETCDKQKSAKRDYISEPRKSGYRSRHIIFKYPTPEYETGLYAELQVRTRLQHAWATAVETYDLAVPNSRLKFNDIDNEPGKFFLGVSKLMAIKESNAALINDNRDQLISSLKEVDRSSGILNTLKAACEANYVINESQETIGSGFYLIDLNIEEQYLKVEELSAEQAVDEYFDRECNSNHNLVLVKGSSFDNIKFAYPNYFGDISPFIDFVNELL